ncbi:hypothetical protein BH10BAC3_BH10BAC3_41940 [soil metagenome]
MKSLLVIMITAGLTLGASAQTKIRGQVPNIDRNGGKQKVIIVSPRPYYNRYNTPYYGYRNWGYSPYGYGYNPYFGFGQASVSVPTELDFQIQRIKSDYGHELSDVRHDKSSSKQDRKQKIRDIKHDRENAIIEAKRDYYNSKGRN